MLALLLVAGIAVSTWMKARERSPAPPAVGGMAPDFVLDDVDGHPHALHEWRGRRVLVTFWAPWSPPALEQVRGMTRLAGGPFVVVDVAIDALDSGQITDVLKGGAAVHLLGRSKPLAAWGSFPILPVTFVVDEAGVVRKVHEGYVDPATL